MFGITSLYNKWSYLHYAAVSHYFYTSPAFLTFLSEVEKHLKHPLRQHQTSVSLIKSHHRTGKSSLFTPWQHFGYIHLFFPLKLVTFLPILWCWQVGIFLTPQHTRSSKPLSKQKSEETFDVGRRRGKGENKKKKSGTPSKQHRLWKFPLNVQVCMDARRNSFTC